MVIQTGMMIENRYEILGKIGSGGMSDVYKAKCHKLNRFVAIKFLKPEYCADKNFVKNFQIEAQSAAALLHPNVVSVYDVNEMNGIYYIVMEYVDGITLKKYIDRNGKLPVKEATSIAIQVAQGIEAAHNANIIHRDIKPQNVLISREGKIKVTDFGIARTTTANTVSSDILGSVQYISPEQARGGQLDNRTDIYSFGIIYYEMITGKLPFDGNSTVSIALKHIQENVPLVSELVDNVPNSVVRIIEKCTQRKPERRYQKMASLLSDLKTSLITPNEDFVILDPEPAESATIVMSAEDARLLKWEGVKENLHSGETVSGTRAKSGTKSRKMNDAFEDEPVTRYASGRSNMNRAGRRIEDTTRKRKENKVLLIGGILAGIIIIAILGVVIFKTFGNGGCTGTLTEPETETSSTETDQVKVPSVVGKKVDTAKSELEKDYYLIVKIKYEHSESIAKDYVIDQSIKANTLVERNSEITLTVSSGQETVKIPDYTNQTQETAMEGLKLLGFTTKITTRNSADIPEGRVIETNPVKNSEVAKDMVIEIIVSLGPEEIWEEPYTEEEETEEDIYVPTFAGNWFEDVESEINQSGFYYEIIDDPNAETGYISYQELGSDGVLYLYVGSFVPPTTEEEPPSESDETSTDEPESEEDTTEAEQPIEDDTTEEDTTVAEASMEEIGF